MIRSINVGTDCAGIKASAIEGVLSSEGIRVNLVFRKTESLPTPLSVDDFNNTIEKRMSLLRASFNQNDQIDYYASIQKGYYKVGRFYFFKAAVSIELPNGKRALSETSTVQLSELSSDKKTNDRNRNLTEILLEEFKDWDRGSVYELLAKEDEKGWLQEPLRHCLRFLER